MTWRDTGRDCGKQGCPNDIPTVIHAGRQGRTGLPPTRTALLTLSRYGTARSSLSARTAWRSALTPAIFDSISWFARNIATGPGRRSKRTDARRWNAGLANNVPGGGGAARIEALSHLAFGCMIIASHGRSCEHGDSNHSSRHVRRYADSNFSIATPSPSLGYAARRAAHPKSRDRIRRYRPETLPRYP